MKSWGFSRMRKQWIPGHFSLRPRGLGTRLKYIHATHTLVEHPKKAYTQWKLKAHTHIHSQYIQVLDVFVNLMHKWLGFKDCWLVSTVCTLWILLFGDRFNICCTIHTYRRVLGWIVQLLNWLLTWNVYTSSLSRELQVLQLSTTGEFGGLTCHENYKCITNRGKNLFSATGLVM